MQKLMTIMKIRVLKILVAIYWTVWVFAAGQTYFVQDYFVKCWVEQTTAIGLCSSGSEWVVSLSFESFGLWITATRSS